MMRTCPSTTLPTAVMRPPKTPRRPRHRRETTMRPTEGHILAPGQSLGQGHPGRPDLEVHHRRPVPVLDPGHARGLAPVLDRRKATAAGRSQNLGPGNRVT